MNKALQDIPIVTADAGKGRRIHLWRRGLQLGAILLAILIPVSGLFRIDPMEGAFVVLDRQVWFSDFYLVVGLWLAISCLLVTTYSLVGTAFCGWVCPQNTLSEWANRMTQKWLGKRAEVSLDGSPLQVSQGKNKWANWLLLGAMFVSVSMAMALIPLFYFYSPDLIWSFVTFQEDPRLAGSLHWIYTIFVLIIAVDIAFIRHFWCRFMCVYRVWQHTFKTRETLHIAHDSSQAEECERCSFCVTSCFIGIDPRRTETFDACINCGECISACARIRASRKTGTSLLRFEVGARQGAGQGGRSNVGSIFARTPWASALALFGLALFSWGIWSYDAFHLSVYRAETLQGENIVDYRISVANKIYRPSTLRVEVAGLPEDAYELSRSAVSFSTAGRQDINLHIDGVLSAGLHPFVVSVIAADGRRESFRVQHYVSGSRL